MLAVDVLAGHVKSFESSIHLRSEVNCSGPEWAVRVTLVYRRDGAERRLVHRHADPLANGVNLERSLERSS
jgi:hypothetical protein